MPSFCYHIDYSVQYTKEYCHRTGMGRTKSAELKQTGPFKGKKQKSNSTIQTDSINFILVELCLWFNFICTQALNIHTLRDFVKIQQNSHTQ